MKRYIGTKQFYQTVLLIALPIMGQQFITTFVNLIDNIMIGRVGNIALTSVTVANQIYLIFNSTMFGICGAAGIYIAQYYGAKNHQRSQDALNINLLVAVLIALGFMILLICFPQIILRFYTNNEEILSSSLAYLKVIRFSYLPYAISFTVMMALRSVAINKIQVVVGTIAVCINTTLNYCLIFGNFFFPELGVMGAAVATLIARMVEMSIYIALLVSKKYYFKLDIDGILHINKQLFNQMTYKAIPLILNEILFSLGNTLIFKSYIRCDEYLVSAISVVDTVSQILFIVFSGLSSAVSIMIGNKLGANLLDEAKDNARKLVLLGFLIALVIGSISFIAAAYIPMFYHVSSDIKEAITVLLRIKSVAILIHAVNVCIFFILRAGGDVVSTLLLDSGFLWVAGVFVSTMLSMFTSIGLVMLCFIVDSLNIFKLCVAFYFLKKERWLRNMTV